MKNARKKMNDIIENSFSEYLKSHERKVAISSQINLNRKKLALRINQSGNRIASIRDSIERTKL